MKGTPIWILLRTVFQSILQVVLVSFSGWFLAKRKVLDKNLLKQLNRLNISVFTPSLLFSKVAFSLSAAKLKELWVMPVFFCIVTFLSFAVAQILARFLKLSKMQRNFAVAACMFMNTNSLPVALMQSLVTSVPHLHWGEDDDSTAMLGRALTYLVLFSCLGMILRWSYGVSLLNGEDDASNRPSILQDEEAGDRTFASPSPIREGTLIDISTEDQPPSQTAETLPGPPRAIPMQKSISAQEAHRKGANPMSHLVFSFPNTPIHSQSNLREGVLRLRQEGGNMGIDEADSTGDESGTDEPLRFTSRHQFSQSVHRRTGTSSNLPVPVSAITRTSKCCLRIWSRLKSFLSAVGEVMTPPLYASILSLVVVLIPPLQTLLNEHSLPLKGALQNAGDCSIPITLVVLGGYFYTPPEEKAHTRYYRSQTEEQRSPGPPTASASSQTIRADHFYLSPSAISLASNPNPIQNGAADGVDVGDPDINGRVNGGKSGQKSRPRRGRSLMSASWDTTQPGETKAVVVALVSRMIIVPVLMFPLFWLSTVTDWQDVFADPVFVVSCILLASSAPAVTLAQIVPKASGDAFERLISRTLFWGYCVLTPPAVIIYVVLGLWLAKL